jgi:hypothetical protein
VFVATVTAFGLRSNQSRRVPDATDQRGRPARVIGLSEADVVELLQSRANWLSCLVLHCCSVDLVVLKVRLSPGSDRIADHSADPGCAKSRHPLTTSLGPSASAAHPPDVVSCLFSRSVPTADAFRRKEFENPACHADRAGPNA